MVEIGDVLNISTSKSDKRDERLKMHITWSKSSFRSPFAIMEKENWTNKLRIFSCFRQRKFKGTLIQGQSTSRKNLLRCTKLYSVFMDIQTVGSSIFVVEQVQLR
ncbi:uncharacterized protein LOC122948655 [Acropora millepora]|uniref:uncharacterized protein LOC122948655 n=1 Tax=Acropora millepora TaxID=45264 RepID=UPI001CF3DE6E|nr:uncharacterized protein LOC122948655 [Acropora millepora]